MRTDLTKVNLLATSDKSDVKVEKGALKVAGLNDMRLEDIISIDIRNQVDEVQALWTIGTTTPTITASTKYIIKVGNTGKKYEGGQDQFRTYAHTSPATLSGNAATDRNAVYTALAALINNDTSADWSATANVGGSGVSMTITDDAGYYKNGRRGEASVYCPLNSDGTGFVQATHLVKTTEPVYAFGVGADLILKTPVMCPLTGNVTDTMQELIYEDLGAISGQDYNAFFISSVVRANFSSIAGEAYLRHNQVLFVDNGAGSDTSNLAGYVAVEKEFEKVLYGQFADDSDAIVEFFEQPGTAGGITTGGAPTGTAGNINVYSTPNSSLTYTVIGTQTLLAPIWTGTGLNISQDLTANDGVEYSAPVGANGKGSFVVGESEFSFRTKIYLTDVSGTDDFAVGFRIKAAFNAAVNSYTDYAVLNAISGDIYIESDLNGAAAASTDTTDNWADATFKTLEVRVDLDGAVTYLIDDVAPTVTAAFTFDAGDELIPFVSLLHDADVAESTLIADWVSIPAIIKRTV